MKQSTIKFEGDDIQIWESDSSPSWRMVYDHQTLIALFNASGFTVTKYTLFEGTEGECLAEASRLGLQATDEFKMNYVGKRIESIPNQIDLVAALLLEMSPFFELATKLTTVVAAISEKTVEIKIP